MIHGLLIAMTKDLESSYHKDCPFVFISGGPYCVDGPSCTCIGGTSSDLGICAITEFAVS
jgi:hypothetical protein